VAPIEASALVFDMDGLLVDSEPLWAAVEAEFARARGGDFTREMAARCVGKGLANTLRVMSDAFGFPIDLERDAADIIDRFVARAGTLALKPGATELVHAASAVVPVALGSSSSRRLVRAVLDAVGMPATFGVVVTGDDVDRAKPAPDIFLACSRQLGAEPAGCVVLEDSLAGVRAGRAAGMRVIAVPEGAANRREIEEHADAVVADLFEARRLIRFRVA
jgi:beta-phosphoglucomutase-like phosphatase (HAD superfamily)